MTEEAQFPFIEKPVECPACKELSPQRSFRSSMFVPKTRESDEHVVSYTWLAKNAKRVHPPHYFLYYCPYCYYTDISDDFSKPKADTLYRRVLKSFNDAGQKERQIIELMGQHVHYDEIDFCSALNLHFLAIFVQMLPPSDAHDSYKLARLLLRIAWLYRENTPDAGDKLQIPSVEEILNGMKTLDMAMQKARKNWDNLSNAVEHRAGELEQQFQGEGDENPYTQCRASLGKQFDRFFAELYRLKTTCKRDLSGTLLDGNAQEAGPFFSFPSYQAFFEKLKSVWPFPPADELEAMHGAISYFQHSVSTDSRFDDPQKRFLTISLITELMVRCGDIDGAFSMVGSLYKVVSDNRQRYMRQMQQKDIDEPTKRRLKVKMERARASLGQAGELRRKLVDKLFERDLPKIKQVLAENEGAAAEEIEKALKEIGIGEAVILRMQEKGGLLENLGKKKKRRFF